MKLKFFLLASFAITILFACQKKDDIDEYKVKADEFRTYLGGKVFRATSFTADKPIDYIDDDSVTKAETDLWKYVKPHIVDDSNIFNEPSTLTIQQNATKSPVNDTAVLVRSYSVSSDSKSVLLEFVDYDYKPLKYRLKEFNDSHMILYVGFRNEATLYSRFDRVQ